MDKMKETITTGQNENPELGTGYEAHGMKKLKANSSKPKVKERPTIKVKAFEREREGSENVASSLKSAACIECSMAGEAIPKIPEAKNQRILLGGNSDIALTGKVWNPITGCDKISDGCRNCYAEKLSVRLKAMGQKKYENEFKLTMHADQLSRPYRWKKPSVIFVNSMSDLFHKDVPTDFIKQVFGVMNNLPQHTFQVLTKRSERLAELSTELLWSHNIWMGVSVENSKVINRIDDLRQCDAKHKFLSCEPLLGSLNNMNLSGIDWVIAGGEGGPGWRPMAEEWALDIRDQCNLAGVVFHFKLTAGLNKRTRVDELAGETYLNFPEGMPNPYL